MFGNPQQKVVQNIFHKRKNNKNIKNNRQKGGMFWNPQQKVNMNRNNTKVLKRNNDRMGRKK